MPSNHLISCHPLILLPSIFRSIRIFPNESALCIRWPKHWSFSFSTRLLFWWISIIQCSVINCSHHALHWSLRLYLSCSWKFMPFHQPLFIFHTDNHLSIPCGMTFFMPHEYDTMQYLSFSAWFIHLMPSRSIHVVKNAKNFSPSVIYVHILIYISHHFSLYWLLGKWWIKTEVQGTSRWASG